MLSRSEPVELSCSDQRRTQAIGLAGNPRAVTNGFEPRHRFHPKSLHELYLQGQLNARPDVSFALSILMLHHFSWSHDGSESNGERPVLNRKLFASAMLALVAASAAHASEGGGSVYLQGTFNDFAVAVSGPPGFYLRNDLVYYDASIDARPRNGVVELGVNQKLWTNLIKVAWIGNGKVLGGTPGLAVALPIILNVDVTATDAGFPQAVVDGLRGEGQRGRGNGVRRVSEGETETGRV